MDYLVMMHRKGAFVGTNVVFRQTETHWGPRPRKDTCEVLVHGELIQGCGEGASFRPELVESGKRKKTAAAPPMQLTDAGRKVAEYELDIRNARPNTESVS